MNSPFSISADTKNRLYLYKVIIGLSLICLTYFIGSALIAEDYRERISRWPMEVMGTAHSSKSSFCRNRCRPPGSEALPEGVVVQTSNLELRPLWDSVLVKEKLKPSLNLLAIAVGVKKKKIVHKIVEKFLSNGFVIMLFHYDGIVDQWSDFKWNNEVIHVSAKNQTKWWFAKRFLHPDIVAEYDYIFLWDEDLDVANFNPQRYINIIKSEGLEISQPALDPVKSVVHQSITARRKNERLHRRYYKSKGSGRCDDNSTAPPCTGWVEMMAPAFSKAAWQCVWYMVQNDLIHAWGLDRQLGYCAQGDRTKKVGVVDSEYIVHLGLPTLGVLERIKESSETLRVDNRPAVRKQSFIEMQVFSQRWNDAVKNSKCWIDIYKQTDQQSN
ncbi:uncharacterized protein LOC110702946 [Chenopodium quinoa]|uniref:Lysine ketoglutarate reductase trans-splicing related 1 n=1 Tax=Chenopodium quinoa TaxID=63459 RepID=A0A803MIG9_CHEQI|nr:uncharacterized protein LOC110702946 [Chenopodium quinoa]